MSLFLGPIHTIVYNKILNLDNLAKKLAYKCNFNDIYDNMDVETIEIGDLASLIGEEPIHPWLARRTAIAEYRYVNVIKKLLEKGITLEKLSEIVFEDGKIFSSELKGIDSVKQIIVKIRFLLLDGMPCDGGMDELESDDNVGVWRTNMEVHEYSLKEVSLDNEVFLTLRDSWLKGLFYDTDYDYNRIDSNIFKVSKK